jgi:hypothetical protein
MRPPDPNFAHDYLDFLGENETAESDPAVSLRQRIGSRGLNETAGSDMKIFVKILSLENCMYSKSLQNIFDTDPSADKMATLSEKYS